MSNLQHTTRLPLRPTNTNKWKSRVVTNDLLERKTRALQGGLNKLKLTMQRDQAKSITDTYDRNRNKEMSRDKPAVNLSSTKPKQMIKCGQCDKVDAKMKCLECVENYCTNCFDQFHLRGALKRHHCIPIFTSPRHNQSFTSDTNLRDLSDKQSNDNLYRTTDVVNEKTSLISFQQSFLQWRDNNINKSQRIQQKRGLVSPTNERIEYPNKLPHIELNSSNKDQYANRNYQESFIQRSKRTNITQNDQSKTGLRDSYSDNTSLTEPMMVNEPLNDHLSTTQIAEDTEIITTEENLDDEQERPVTHVSTKSFSRPSTSASKKDPISSRPNSATLVQQSLRSVLTTKSTDELEAIINSQLILSRPSSSNAEKLDQPLKWQPLQSTSNNIDVQSVIIDQNTVDQFDLALDDLLDESKIELSYRLNQSSTRDFPMNSTTTTPRRHSPFSFSNSLYRTSRILSAGSKDIGEGGFFTDVTPRQIVTSSIPLPPIPLPIFERSTSNEWEYALENQSTEQDQTIPVRKLSSKSLSRVSSKHSVKHEEIRHRPKSQTGNHSRPHSSLSSSSLPVSTTSSKPGFNNSEVLSSSTSKASSTATLKNPSPQPPESIIPITTEDKKETSSCNSDDCLQESMISLKDKSSPNVHTSENTSDLITFITRGENITENDLPMKKRTRRRRHTTVSDELAGFRKLEFSVGDGFKWQEVSLESLSSMEIIPSKQSSNDTTPRTLTPSNPINTKLAEQFSKYDNDDGRSSLTYQNLNDEECFNQLRQELCSELVMRGSDEDAILNDHILQILQGGQIASNEKDLRENELVHQPSIDNELLIHE